MKIWNLRYAYAFLISERADPCGCGLPWNTKNRDVEGLWDDKVREAGLSKYVPRRVAVLAL
jgi:hypothetical protein